jgi:hypothetical protein
MQYPITSPMLDGLDGIRSFPNVSSLFPMSFQMHDVPSPLYLHVRTGVSCTKQRAPRPRNRLRAVELFTGYPACPLGAISSLSVSLRISTSADAALTLNQTISSPGCDKGATLHIANKAPLAITTTRLPYLVFVSNLHLCNRLFVALAALQ